MAPTRRRFTVSVVAVLGCWLLIAHVRTERHDTQRVSDILQEMDRRALHMPPCPTLLTAPTLEALRQSCPAFQGWSDGAALTYLKLHQTGKLVVYSNR